MTDIMVPETSKLKLYRVRAVLTKSGKLDITLKLVVSGLFAFRPDGKVIIWFI